LAARVAPPYANAVRAAIGATALAMSMGFAVVLGSSAAEARAVHDSPYTYEQTFGTTLRLVKVDLGLEITETDPEWGFLLFVYTSAESGDRKNRGSFTLVRGEHKVQVALQLPEMPGYHEQVIMNKLRRKLEEEHGAPPKPPKKPRDDGRDKDDKKKERGKDEERKRPRKDDDEPNGDEPPKKRRRKESSE
jgi:hypothetical protein